MEASKLLESRAGLARQAAIVMGSLPTEQKNAALEAIALALESQADTIFAANALDLEAAKKDNLAMPLQKRLVFDDKKLAAVVAGIRGIIKLPDPVGRILSARELDEGLVLRQVGCPIGLIGIIFESRPDSLVQISTLCLKSGNAVLLKGGSEALNTNRALYETIAKASIQMGIPKDWIVLLETREDVKAMLSLDSYIDLIIPRGSNSFVKYIIDNTSIPVMGHADGICHVYVDEGADIDLAVKVTVDSKTQYVAVCNAAETLLVHKEIAGRFLPELKLAMPKVELRGCPRTRAIIECEIASDDDWSTEYLDYILSIKVVDSLYEAIEHINRYGSRHTDCIVTRDGERAERFMNLVDSAGVFLNASTRFADGFIYGLGAEVGISTAKIHARGPVGLEGLSIYKWKLYGAGHIVADYASGSRKYTHRDLS